MKYLLGIDFGGGASKATLLSENGEVCAESLVEYPTLYPQSGWAEQKPDDWYDAVCKNVRSVLSESGAQSQEIAAIALDAATHTAVLADENFNVLRPAIYWTDTRCMEQVKEIKDNPVIVNQALHLPDTIWTLPQLMWVRDNEPEIWAKTKKIMFAKDYVRHCLTGDYVTDCIEAEGSMLFDFNTLKWSRELCEIAGLDMSILPQIVKPTDIVGKITQKAADETGLSEGTPVVCGTTDTVMEVLASGGVKKGNMTVKLATAGRICVVTDKAYPNRHLINYSHTVDGLWYPGTATKSCAASYRWYRDTFGGDFKELDAAAEKLPVGAEGLLFHPYLNGELTPYADPMLRGSFTGIRAGHTKAHFSRAVMEGVALSLLDCKTALEEIGIPHDAQAAVIGGGGKSPLWRKITADVLGITLAQKKHSDSSFGTAMLAGVAIGVFDSFETAVNVCNKTVSKTKPNMANHKKYLKIFKFYKEVHDALAPLYDKGWIKGG